MQFGIVTEYVFENFQIGKKIRYPGHWWPPGKVLLNAMMLLFVTYLPISSIGNMHDFLKMVKFGMW